MNPLLPDWSARAACLHGDPEAWFPEKGEDGQAAKRVCNGTDTTEPCPVRDLCLTHALDHDETVGVWGGMTSNERRMLRRRAS